MNVSVSATRLKCQAYLLRTAKRPNVLVFDEELLVEIESIYIENSFFF